MIINYDNDDNGSGYDMVWWATFLCNFFVSLYYLFLLSYFNVLFIFIFKKKVYIWIYAYLIVVYYLYKFVI